jgi:hypothetical protein
MEEGSLFVLLSTDEIHQTKMLQIVILVSFGKLVGCMGLVPWHLDLQCKSSWILNDFFPEN